MYTLVVVGKTGRAAWSTLVID